MVYNHKKVSKVAFVTDSTVGDFAEHIGSHFVQAKVKHFAFDELNSAKEWISSESQKYDAQKKR